METRHAFDMCINIHKCMLTYSYVMTRRDQGPELYCHVSVGDSFKCAFLTILKVNVSKSLAQQLTSS